MSYLDTLFDLTGRVVIITGGSRGLGREIAFGCAQAGADVVIASRKLDACEQTAAEIEKLTGRQAMPYALHVGRWDQLDGLSSPTWSELLHYLRLPRRLELAESAASDVLRSHGEQSQRVAELSELLTACTLL